MRRILLYGIGAVVLIAVGVGIWLYNSTQQIPPEYERMLKADPVVQRQASTEMFNRSQRLVREAKKAGAWKASFSGDEINGYLAVDPEGVVKRLLPAQASDPRIAVGERTMTLYCRVSDDRLSSVLSVEVEPFVTSQRDVLGMRLRSVHAGALSLPLGRVKEMISQATSETDFSLRWADEEGDPVARVTLPSKNGRKLNLDAVEISQGQIRIAGKTKG